MINTDFLSMLEWWGEGLENTYISYYERKDGIFLLEVYRPINAEDTKWFYCFTPDDRIKVVKRAFECMEENNGVLEMDDFSDILGEFRGVFY